MINPRKGATDTGAGNGQEFAPSVDGKGVISGLGAEDPGGSSVDSNGLLLVPSHRHSPEE